MTHPTGTSLATVTFGKPLGAAGTEAHIDATVTVDRPIVWAETGQTLYVVPDPVTSGDVNYLTFQVPHVDQAGYLDLNGDDTTNWAYTLNADVRLGNRTFSITRTFQVFEGQEFVDLDLVATDDVITPGVTAPGPAVLSLAGETGVVTLEELEAMIEPGLARTYPRKAIITGAGIDPTGATETDAAAVQTIIDGAYAARVPALLPIGRHLFDPDAQLSFPDDTVFEGEGPGSVLVTTHIDINDPTHFLVNSDRVLGNENITLRNFTVEGLSPGGPTGVPSSPGVTCLMQRVRRLFVEGLTFKNTFGPALYMDGVQIGRAVGCLVLDCGRGGIIANSKPGVWGLEDILIANNIVWGVGDDALAVASLVTGAALCRGVVVAGNVVNGVYLEAYNEDDPDDGGRGFLGIGVSGLTLAGNYFGETASRAVLIKAQRDDGTRSEHVTMGVNTCFRNGPIDSVQSSQGVFVQETDHVDLGALTVAEAGAAGVVLDDVTDVKGNLSVVDCGTVLAHFGLNVLNSAHVDLKLSATGNAGPGLHIADQTGPVRVSGEWWDNSNAGDGTGNTGAGVLLDTAGEVTLDGSSNDYRAPAQKQSYGLAVINQAPSLLRLMGGRYDLNPLGGLRFATAPTRLLMRDVVQSLTDPTLNYDVGVTGIREYSVIATPAFAAPIGSRARVTDGQTYVNLTGLASGWVPLRVGYTPVDRTKAADQSTTGLTFTDLADFTWPVVAQATYEVLGLLDYTAPLTGDISFQWISPAGTTGLWNGDGVASNATSGSASVLRNRQTQSGVSSPGGIGAGHLVSRPFGRFKTLNTAGTLKLQFAQASAVSGGDVGVESVVYAGSFLTLERVA